MKAYASRNALPHIRVSLPMAAWRPPIRIS